MNYWLDLFTVQTYEEFQKAGANVTGFRDRRADDHGKTPDDVQQRRGADRQLACSDGQRGPDEHGSMLWLLGRPDEGGRVGKTLTINESVRG